LENLVKYNYYALRPLRKIFAVSAVKDAMEYKELMKTKDAIFL